MNTSMFTISLQMFFPRGGCKHPVTASEKPVPGFLLADAALASGIIGKCANDLEKEAHKCLLT